MTTPQAPRVGEEAPAYCTSCRTMREHIVVAMVGAVPAKVECLSCHRQHLYRAHAPGTAPARAPRETRARSSTRVRAAAPAPPPAVDLDRLLAGKTPRAYHPDTCFAVGDAVRHPTFGMGAVVALPGAQKMEVEFQAGRKLLTHDRAAAVPSTLTRPAASSDADDKRPVTDAPPRKR